VHNLELTNSIKPWYKIAAHGCSESALKAKYLNFQSINHAFSLHRMRPPSEQRVAIGKLEKILKEVRVDGNFPSFFPQGGLNVDPVVMGILQKI
jgi:hypothetical protein